MFRVSFVRSKTHKRLKESLFDKMKQDKKSEARFILFHFIKKRSFNLLCVFGSFFRTLSVNSVSDFDFFFFWGGVSFVSHDYRDRTHKTPSYVVVTRRPDALEGLERCMLRSAARDQYQRGQR